MALSGADRRRSAQSRPSDAEPRRRKRILPRWPVLLLLVILAIASDTETLGTGHQVTISGFTPQQSYVIQSALERFELASLDIPRTHIRYSKGAGPCTRRGRAADTWPIAYVEVCEVLEDVVVHELAHVWAFASLDHDQRRSWNDLRGVPTWRSRQHAWEMRGSEHAADILTWYLYWTDFAAPRHRIGGEHSPDRYIADVEWLLETADATPALEVFDKRASLIEVAYGAGGWAG